MDSIIGLLSITVAILAFLQAGTMIQARRKKNGNNHSDNPGPIHDQLISINTQLTNIDGKLSTISSQQGTTNLRLGDIWEKVNKD